MNEITFLHLHLGLSIKEPLSFNRGKFIADPLSSSTHPQTGESYRNLNSLVIFSDQDLGDENEIQEMLFDCYQEALEILSAVAGRFQCYAYLGQPITCNLNGEEYHLFEHRFKKVSFLTNLHIISGGRNYCDDLSFLNRSRSSSRILDFYREAYDETKPLDYRILQLWRFFEGWYKLKDSALKQKLISLKTYKVFCGYNTDTHERIVRIYRIRKRSINHFYSYYRCAVAHGGGSASWQAKKVIIPREANTSADLLGVLHVMIEIADYILQEAPKSRL
jgi:hypothetical protein